MVHSARVKRRAALIGCLFVAVTFSALFWASYVSPPLNYSNAPYALENDNSWTPRDGADVDTYLIHYSIARYPTLASTAGWWYGPWGPADLDVPGQPGNHMTFYRPVPSLTFWAEWKLLGRDELRYQLFNRVFCGLTSCAFLAATMLLCRRFAIKAFWPTVFVAVVTYFNLLDAYINPQASATSALVFGYWKNLPDSQAAFFALTAVCAYLLVQGRSKALSSAPYWMLPLFLACASKEVVILLPLALMLLELPCLREPGNGARRRIALLGAFFVGFQLFRLAALGGVGYRYGSANVAYHLLTTTLHPVGDYLWSPDPLPILVASTAWVAFAVGTKVYPRWAGQKHAFATWLLFGMFWAFVAVVLLSTACDMSDNVQPWLSPVWAACASVGVATVLSITFRSHGRRLRGGGSSALPSKPAVVCAGLWLLAAGAAYAILTDRFFTALFLLADAINGRFASLFGLAVAPIAVWYAIRRQAGPALLFAWAWTVVSGLPNVVSPGPVHRDYVPNIGWCWFYGISVAVAASALWNRVANLVPASFAALTAHSQPQHTISTTR